MKLDISAIWIFLAGLGFFLYGMNQLEKVLKNIPGRSFKLFIKNNTNNLFKSILGSAVITGIVQSSSVISLITLSFVEAGIIPFRNALGVILGANLGTTFDSWIIAFIGFKLNILNYAIPFIAVAAIGLFVFDKKENWKNIFAVFLYLGFLFMGINYMKDGALTIAKDFQLNQYTNHGTLTFVFIGFVLTTMIQSRSASIAISLSALYAGIIQFPQAAAMVIGAEVGTTVKTLLWSMKGSIDKRRVGWANFIFNLFTALISTLMLNRIIDVIENIIYIRDPLIGLVFFQSTINLLSIIIFIPFANLFAKWIEKLIVKKNTDELSFAKQDLPLIPTLAVEALSHEGKNLFSKTRQYCHKLLCLDENGQSQLTHREDLENLYSRIKKTEGDLNEYFIKLPTHNMIKHEIQHLTITLSAIRRIVYAAKSIKDIQHNLINFDSSIDDFIHDQRKLIHEMWLIFEDELTDLIKNQNLTDYLKLYHEMIERRNLWNDQRRSDVLQKLRSHEINELDASTLLNVYRALYTCKKALLKAILELHQLDMQELP